MVRATDRGRGRPRVGRPVKVEDGDQTGRLPMIDSDPMVRRLANASIAIGRGRATSAGCAQKIDRMADVRTVVHGDDRTIQRMSYRRGRNRRRRISSRFRDRYRPVRWPT